MTVDLSRIKPGDEVTVRLVVGGRPCSHDGGKCLICRSDGMTDVHIHPSRIVSHTPKPPEVGDRVKVNSPFGDRDEGHGSEWVLLHKDDSTLALVGRGTHTRAIRALADLERIP